MSSLRRLWFEPRRLLRGNREDQHGADSPSVLAELDALPAAARETILAAGDRLASVSLTLAQGYCRSAPAAWRAFGAGDFARWVAMGERLAVREPTSRDGAAAYFAVLPADLARIGLDDAEAWAEIGRDLSGVSRRLGAQFLATSAPLLAGLPEPRVPRLHAWAEHGRGLLSKEGWKGEFLAVAYFAAAPAALPVLSPDEMAVWAALGVSVQDAAGRGGRWEFYARLPDGYADLDVALRRDLLDACLDAAHDAPAAAEAVFRGLPGVLAGLPAELRPFLFSVLAPVVRSAPAALPKLCPLIGPCLRAVGIDRRPAVRDALVRLARDFVPGVPPALRSLPRAFEDAGEAHLRDWIATGCDIGCANRDAGVAYFALESRTSLRVLHRDGTGVDLEAVEQVLRKYIHMVSGTAAGIQRQEFFSYPPSLEASAAGAPAGDAVPLPARIDLCPTYEDNFRLLRVLAVLQAGRREFGTYAFRAGTVWPRLSPAVHRLVDELPAPARGLPAFFACFAHPEAVEALFLLVETRRVAHRLRGAYPGLRRDLDWLDGLTLPSLLPDALRRVFADIVPPNGRHAPGREADGDSVYDSACWAAETYARILSALVRVLPEDQDPAAFEAALFEKMTGDALLDPTPDDEEPPSPTPDVSGLELEPEEGEDAGGAPLSPEELKALIEAGVELHLRQGASDTPSPQGLYVTDLDGKLPVGVAAASDPEALPPDTVVSARRGRANGEAATYCYDEWDYLIADYRPRWCRLHEITLGGDAGEFFSRTLGDYATLTPAIKAEFRRIRPEQYRRVRGLEDGEEFDLNAVVTAASDRRARVPPSSKLYTTRRQTERDVAALFLLDMSASTDEPVEPVAPAAHDDEADDWPAAAKPPPPVPPPPPRRIIDVTKEALVLMAEALEEIGDAYAVYGFSGQGRDNVEFYHVKAFTEPLSPTVQGRIGAIEPKRSTRMGPAIRHALEKLKDVACRVKLLVLLSDGFPQDLDYGSDRRSTTYGIQDTMMALREADRAGVLTFCLTVDKAGHDYLREMCAPSRYLVLEDVASLPTELPKVYQRSIRPFDKRRHLPPQVR